MELLSSPKVIKSIIEKYGFKFSKSLGQNFLIDGNIVNKIVDLSAVGSDDYVIEIGPGIGTLTQVICSRAKKVVAIEIDSKLIPILNENLRDVKNLKIINQDILKTDINKVIKEEFDGKAVKVIGNLPYYVTTPIIMNLLENGYNISSVTMMIQKEVAERIGAKPSTKEYGALTVAIQYYSNIVTGFIVSKNCFMPSPKVDSLVLRLDILENPLVNLKDKQKFFKVIRAAFSQRRKTLLNSLINTGMFDISKDEVLKIFMKIGIKETQRGETLSIEQFAKLANELS